MAHLEKEGAVAKSSAAFDTLAAAHTQLFIYNIFVIGMFDKAALDGSCGAKLVFCASVQCVGLRLEVAGAELTIPAHGEFVDAFDSRVLQNTVIGAPLALDTFIGVQLPDGIIRLTPGSQQAYCASQTQQTRPAYAVPDEIPSGHFAFILCHAQSISFRVNTASGCSHLLRNVHFLQASMLAGSPVADADFLRANKVPVAPNNPPRSR